MKDIVEHIKAGDAFARYCGIELLQASEGYAKAKMSIQPFHLNGAGTVHGGAIFTLADFVFAVASNSRGQLALAAHSGIAFINAGYGGVLYAESRELSVNRHLSVYGISVTDEAGKLIADMQATAFRKDRSIVS
ncbi:hotdog fold thioesterase [Desulfococcaceae bacterium OttesenSCG-928-F15]|nr:hotdog fold thioesterase [Desulfococcaceae bacterium OttesenSCG-928-F15]